MALDQLTRPELFCSRTKESQGHCRRQVMLYHYQAITWKQAHRSEPHPPDPKTLGWKKIADNKLQPLLMIQDPIPKA